MPWASARPCRRSPSGCPNKTTARDGYCEKCRAIARRQQDASPWRRSSHAFLKSAAWRALAAQVKAEEPICRECTKELTTDADHIIDRFERPDLALERSNVQGLCKGCHRAKSGREARRRQLGRKSA